MYFLKVTNQLLQSFPANLTPKKRIWNVNSKFFTGKFSWLAEGDLLLTALLEKNTCWNTSVSAFGMVWKADNTKRLCNLMQVHPWAKCVTGLGNIKKAHLNQTQFSPVAPGICFGDLGGFWCRCDRFPCALILTKPITWGSSEVCQNHKWHTPFHCWHYQSCLSTEISHEISMH